MMKAGGFGKQILDTTSVLSLILLLVIGGVKKDVWSLWLSGLMLVWKASRCTTQELMEGQFAINIKAAVEPLHVDNVRLSYDLGLLRNENEALRQADRLLWERAEESEKIAVRLREEMKQLEVKVSRLKDDLAGARKQIDDKEDQILALDLYNERLDVQLRTHKDVEREKLSIKDNEIRKFEAQLQDAKRRFEDSLKAAHRNEDKAREDLQQALAQVAILKDEIDRLLAPKRLTEVAWYKNFCNSVCDWLGEQGILVDLLRATENEGVLSLTVRPKKLSDLPVLETVRNKLFYAFELPVKPSFEVGTHEAVIHIYDKKKAKEHKFFVPSETWFSDVLIREKNGRKTTLHGRFVGESESGKSTLVVNGIGCVKQFIPGVEVRIADPLFYVGDTDWKGHKVSFKTEEETFEALVAFYKLFQDRKDNVVPKTHTVVFLLDEFDTMIANYPQLEPMVKAIWKQGRHSETYLWTSGQSPLVADFGLRRDDVQNCFGMYLGTTIPRSFADCFITGEESVKWLYEYNERKKTGEKYLVFVRPKFDTAFMTQTPQPGTYAATALAEPPQTERNSTEGEPNYESLEFDLSSTRKALETLVSDDQTELRVRVLQLAKQNLTPSQIVNRVWGLKPSRSRDYKDKLNLVQRLLDRSK